ncbi:MAG: uncharacterized protein A8A55_2420 [Amphiamblys sp. WSBS2006]|nr:MAG: uncharacterized protein A8A55_2420 [Amphiamblys sp. WSBS2006]
MEPGTTKTLKHKKMFFVFARKGTFLFPEREYNLINQEEGYVCLKRKHLPEETDRGAERLICIVCHVETQLEDFVSPLCRQMHFVLCRECMEYLKGRTDKREVFCPYCKEKKNDKAYQEEIRAVLFSLMPRQTLPRLELRPDTEVKTVTRLAQETRVVLSNITVSDTLFFCLMSRTAVEIKNAISLFDHDITLDWCLGGPGWEAGRRTKICVCECSKEEAEWIHANTTDSGMSISPWKVRGNENEICVFLRFWACLDENNRNVFVCFPGKHATKEILGEGNNSLWTGKVESLKLKNSATKIFPKLRFPGENEMEELGLDADCSEHITEILEEDNNSLWVGKVKKMELCGHAVEILPKLGIHQENVLEELALDTEHFLNATGILGMENNSLWVGRVKRLVLKNHAVEILPKLRTHGEDVMEELVLDADNAEHLAEILKTETNSVWAGRVKRLELRGYAVQILPKLKFHEENEMEELDLDADEAEYLTEMLRTKNSSILVGKVKKLNLRHYAMKILPKLKFHKESAMEELVLNAKHFGETAGIYKKKNKGIWIGKVKRLELGGWAIGILPKLRVHEENEMEEFGLWADSPGYITRVLKEENNSVWVGKVERLKLRGYAVQILPKLRIHEENVMEELELDAKRTEHLAKIHKTENNSIWVGRVKRLDLRGYMLEILPKLRIHEENVMEEFNLHVLNPALISELLKVVNKSIWLGKVKKLRLAGSAVEILPKLRLHEENVMGELVLSTDRAVYIAGMLGMENKGIWIGKVWKISLEGYAKEIEDKLDFTLMDSHIGKDVFE